MIKNYSFIEIKKYLKKDSSVGKDILDAFDVISDAAIIFSTMAFGVQHLLPIVELLDVKDRLLQFGNKVYDAIAKRNETDYISRTEQLKSAYALICYTSYFDALQDILPEQLRKKLKSNLEQQKNLLEDTKISYENIKSNICCDIFYANHITSFADIKEQLIDKYKYITNRIIRIVIDGNVFKNTSDKQQFKKALDKLPENALNVYESQYINLADNFNDFALFAQLKNFQGINKTIKNNEKALNSLISITNDLDVGLNNLKELVNSISTNYSTIQAQTIVEELKTKYIAIINEPIIDDKEIKPETETISLKFPKIVDAFIPQSYKCFLYEEKGTKLEDTNIWKNLPIQHDIDKFFIKYLYSLDSIDYPLIVLGHPGSGKSLLTKVLSAQLMSESYTVIRIPLRDVNAEDSIDVLVEDQIKKITNRSLSTEGYGGFAAQFSEKPLIIILDGYDELLQAKGSVFSGYLETVRTFQQNQKLQKRPVRIIVTSRITLIDKARIPVNSTILRLIEFNENQRQKWIDIWNNTNTEYFISANIKSFKLPHKGKGKRNSIIELAEQPLLLLMLALYDSEANELAKTNDIKKTELYDNLLRRFVRRERSRYIPNFNDKSPNEQQIIIDQEMNRLGVIAIGMYNRRDVVIHSDQLERDLEAFQAHRDNSYSIERTLTDAESVLGSFFFIHKSTAQDTSADCKTVTNAYEFLHNTFGEFLAADFILRNTIIETKNTYIDRKYKSSDYKDYSPDSFAANWFYCLMFVALYSRPVVVEMLREHAITAFQRYKQIYNLSIDISESDFIDTLKYIVCNQLKMVLNTRNCPKIMCNGVLFDNDISLLGYLSTYTLNLVILISAISKDGFEFNENDYSKSEITKLELKPWDKLASLWKAWFPPSDLVGLSVILKAERKNDKIVHIMCNTKFEATHYEQPIDILLCISSTLADTLLTSLSGLHTSRFIEISHLSEEALWRALQHESFDLYVNRLINLLRREINKLSVVSNYIDNVNASYQYINFLIEKMFNNVQICSINVDTALSLFETIETCLSEGYVFFSTRIMLINVIPDLVDNYNIDSAISISITKLIQLLIPNINIIIQEMSLPYNEYQHRSIMLVGDWAESVEQVMRLFFHYKNDKIVEICKINGNESQLKSFVNCFENYELFDSKQYENVLMKFVSNNNIDILSETNPELISDAILILFKNDNYRRQISNSTIKRFLNSILQQLSSAGIGYIGFNTILNAIQISYYINDSDFIDESAKIIYNQLFTRSSRNFSYVMYLYPEFIDKLMNVFPALFLRCSSNIVEAITYIAINSHNISIKKLFSYLRIFRHFYEMFDIENASQKSILRSLYKLSYRLSENDVFSLIEIEKLTLTQLADLQWFLKIIKDNYNFDRIKAKLFSHPFFYDDYCHF